MRNTENLYIKNKLDSTLFISNFYNWFKIHFKGTLLIRENSNIKNATLIELIDNKKLLLNEINACEALLKLNEHDENCDSLSGTINVNDNKKQTNNNNNNNNNNINISSNNIHSNNIQRCSYSTTRWCNFSCNVLDYFHILKIEELKDFLKDYIFTNKKINKEFFDVIEQDMINWKNLFFFGNQKKKPGFLDFLLLSVLKKQNIHSIEETQYKNLYNWFNNNNNMCDVLKHKKENAKNEDNTHNTSNTNFIQQIIEEDLKNKKHTHVITRFPPEPNGYLHLGHAKSICLNFGLSNKYGGRTHLRFDDTNPVTEEIRYIESIKEDVKWLGYDWKEHLYFASNYFEQLYEWAKILIKQGDAYVDDQSIEEIRKNRGNLKEPGIDSPYRNRSVEENLKLFENMKNGLYKEGEKVLRAKIDMTSGNMNLRDPILYRIMFKTHPKTKNKWVIYPMYDYAHGQSDSIENITHSICTLEFETHRPLYEWFQNKLNIFKTRQIEFARLNVTYMVMSKRKLLALVNEKYVNDWDDPRMPTISGMRRRGYSPDAIKDFCSKVGIAKRENMIPLDLLELCVREDMDIKAIRLFAILKPLKVIITNYNHTPDYLHIHKLVANNHPKFEQMGSRNIQFEKEIFIDQDDFQEIPQDNFFRLAPNRTVRLRYAFCITCNEVIKDDQGKVLELRCTYDPSSKSGLSTNQNKKNDDKKNDDKKSDDKKSDDKKNDDKKNDVIQQNIDDNNIAQGDNKKVKATIHWLCANNSHQAEFRMYDKLFTKPNPESNEDNELIQKITSTIHLENNTNNQSNGKDEYASNSLIQNEQLEDESKNAGWRKYINKNSLIIYKGLVENYATRFNVGDPIQFERVGFFTKDKDTTSELPVFNLTVPLVDNTMLKKKKEDLLQKELDKLKREKIAAERKLKKEQKKIREQKKKEQNANN
ncbi:glutamine--tRNA ligase, putative [Plasmodium gaboni]|uniref:glutamine--tRNA ligase n=1 Tax=Plasmodium gaboni TaxID=647221 RepID=A0ABY1URY9_9APIC|nr:glutamine--tRNA ligase, putative [Plasmodium gaboni]